MPLPSILLVEDSPEDVELARLALARAGSPHLLVVAEDGAIAIDRLAGVEEPVPALVLLDLKLPRVDGMMVLREMRRRDRTRFVPVVVLTSSAAERDIHDAYVAGANGYVVKPLDFHSFQEAIGDILGAWLGVLPRPIHDRSREAQKAPTTREDVLVVLADPREQVLAAEIFASTSRGPVHRAGSVAAARQFLATRPESLRHVLVDLHLPDGAGNEVVEAARSACDRRVTVVVSAHESTDAERRASLEAGTNAVTTRPRDPALLDALLRALARFWLGWNRVPAGGCALAPSIKPPGPA